jgi:ABC-type transport system involved in cytochrome bd biosynthesis fused ATPase/permease subunit
LYRPDARLVILDEPFRGLDRERRRVLLARARAFWKDATLVCITHDVRETASFSRVLVIEDKRVVEDGAPEVLSSPGTRYRALLDAEDAARELLWGGKQWKRLWLEGGQGKALEKEPMS